MSTSVEVSRIFLSKGLKLRKKCASIRVHEHYTNKIDQDGGPLFINGRSIASLSVNINNPNILLIPSLDCLENFISNIHY
jgi:hypothetical protein